MVAGLVLAGSVIAAPAGAAPCLTEAEVDAERAIRLHTELMVVGLTCEPTPVEGRPSLFARYREFTDRHQVDVRAWEQTLIGHYRRTAKGNANRRFDSFRTALANETSRKAIALTNPVFCGTYVPVVEQIMALSREELRARLGTVEVGHISSLPRCPAKNTSARTAVESSSPVPVPAQPGAETAVAR
ncbi:MAG: hypothetical protein RLY86_2757 [Pseudomonadota bacterium]